MPGATPPSILPSPPPRTEPLTLSTPSGRSTTRQNGRWVNARAYTCIAYLTPGRGVEGGGALVLRGVGDDGDDVRVFPEAGRIVVFDSRAVRHEVTPIVGLKPGEARVALTLWALDPETPLAGGAP